MTNISVVTVVTQESFLCRLRLPNERLPDHQPLLQPLRAHAQGHHGEKHQKVQKGLKTHVEKELKLIPKYQKGTEGIWSGRGTPWPRRVGKVLCKKVVKESKIVYGSPPCNRV